ncbi:MAG: MFS transporter [Bacteroidia bacterium]|nr:MFS transporter [Bacteroidia bacterium]
MSLINIVAKKNQRYQASMILSLYRNAFRNLQRNAWILSIAMFINRSGSMVLLFTSLYLTNELHYSISEAGIIMSFYGIGSVLGSYAGGWLTDRRNYYDIMIFSLIASGLILLLMLTATSMIFLCAIIFFYAYAADMFRPANSAAIAAYSTVENRTRSVSLIRLAINLGFSVGPAAGGFIAHYLGYKLLFVVDAFTSFAAALMLYLYLPKKKHEVSPHKDAVLGDSRTSAYRDRRYLFFILLVALYGTCFFQLFASVPQYFSKVCNYTEDVIGLLLALNGVLVVVIEMPLIGLLEKRKKIFPFIIAGALCLPVAFAVLKAGSGLMLWAVIYTFIITISEIFAMPFMMNYALTRPRQERQGQYSALYSIAFGLAIIAAPSLGLGIAGQYGFNVLFIFLIALGFVVALGFTALNRRENRV